MLPRCLAVMLACLLLPVIARAGDRVVAYVPNWIDLPAFAETIDYAHVTHLNVAFENAILDDGQLSFEPKDAALVARAKEHGIPVLVSIGGGAASSNPTSVVRYATLLKAAGRAAFVKKLARYVSEHGFSGLDVDLEGPAISPDYGAFIADLAAVLKPQGKLLTAALSQGYGGDKVPDSVFASLDFVNIMAYDGTGPWDPDHPGQPSSLSFARDNVQYWLRRGLPKDKAVLGVPFYGYGFGAAFRQRDYPYKDLLDQFSGAEQHDQVGNTIWYNGLATLRAKASYVREEGLGGVMIWSLDDDVPGPRALLGAIQAGLQPAPGK